MAIRVCVRVFVRVPPSPQAPEVSRVVVVTNQFHGYRSLRTFARAAGARLAVDICEVPEESDVATLQKDFFRELAAIALYAWRGWI